MWRHGRSSSTVNRTLRNADQASAAPVLVEQHGPVLVVTINRPSRRNAVDLAVAVGVGDAIADADTDPAVRAVVLTGSGDRAFCAGGDVTALGRGEAVLPTDPIRRARGFAGLVTHHIDKPIIAAVNGAAIGGGFELVLACDLAVASRNAVFGVPEVAIGKLAGAGGAFRLPAQVPPKIAMEMLMTGEPIDASRALELGLVNRVVPSEDVLDSAMALAEAISKHPLAAVRAAKRVAAGIVNGRVPDEERSWARSNYERAELRRSAAERDAAPVDITKGMK